MTNAPFPAELCQKEPDIARYGFYRRLDSGQLEFVSFCNPEARRWLSIHERDLEEILNETLPKELARSALKDLRQVRRGALEALKAAAGG